MNWRSDLKINVRIGGIDGEREGERDREGEGGRDVGTGRPSSQSHSEWY